MPQALAVDDSVVFTAGWTGRFCTWPKGVMLEKGQTYHAKVVAVHEDRYKTPDDDTSFATLLLDNGAMVAVDWPADPSVTRP